MTPSRIVVVGASLAGATAAVALRRLGFSGQLVLLGAEPHLPYERPPLSKGFLQGGIAADTLLIHPRSTYEELRIELRLGAAATGLDADAQSVHVGDGSVVPYDALVIATGSVNTTPNLPGLSLPGVHQLRTLDEADSLTRDLDAARRAVVVGMGFIGCEVASALRGRGLDVTMVDRVEGPLVGQLGPGLSARVRDWHESRGVHLLSGVDVAAFEGSSAVESVRLVDGRVLPADVVVVGVGVRPATDWLVEAPLHLERGAVGVDELGRTSLPHVYAAGDVVSTWDAARGSHVRTEHYRSATDQATRVAHALLGAPVPAGQPSWFWSEQYEHVLHYAGDRDGTVLHEREDPHLALFTRGSTVTAVAAIDNARDFRRTLHLLGSDVDPTGLLSAPPLQDAVAG